MPPLPFFFFLALLTISRLWQHIGSCIGFFSYMSQIFLAAGDGLLSSSVDNAGRKPWDSWQNAVTKVGQTVNPQTPTKNMVSTTKKNPLRSKTTGFMQHPTLESKNVAVSLASRGMTSYGCLCCISCAFTSQTMSPAELQKHNNPLSVWMIHMSCFYLSIHDQANPQCVWKKKKLWIFQGNSAQSGTAVKSKYIMILWAIWAQCLPAKPEDFSLHWFPSWQLLILYLIPIPQRLESFCSSFHQWISRWSLTKVGLMKTVCEHCNAKWRLLSSYTLYDSVGQPSLEAHKIC